jgi:hypothetical protein
MRLLPEEQHRGASQANSILLYLGEHQHVATEAKFATGGSGRTMDLSVVFGELWSVPNPDMHLPGVMALIPVQLSSSVLKYRHAYGG